MDLKNFFMFDVGFSQVPVCAFNENLDWDTNCRLLKGEHIDLAFPIKFKQSSGRKWTDVLNPNSVSMYFFSQRFINLLEINEIKGWKNYPIIILDKKGNEISGYSGFSILGKCGKIDYSKSEVYEKRLVPNGLLSKYYKGLHVDWDEWDGSDFFIPKDTLHVVVSEKVKQIITKNKITNVVLQNLAEYEISEYALPKGIQ